MKIAVMGFGTVGSGVVELMDINKASITQKSRYGELEVKYILDLRDFPDSKYNKLIVHDFNTILNDDEISVVVETMGGLKPAFDFVKQCLEKGKSVVTSNKELVAAKGFELLETARKNNVNFMFEASVGGGIPIIRPMSQCLSANTFDEIAGILNGTTNYILTKMINEGVSFEDALKTAQELGYAEKDPTADVEGFDACRKICILASLSYGKHIYPESVETSGITKITLDDVDYASREGYVIKLIASARKLDDGKITATVSPALVKKDSQLAGVSDVFNAVLVKGNATGDVLFYGKGAGKFPTASAVVADVIDCANNKEKTKLFGWNSDSVENYVVPFSETENKFYVRGKGKLDGVETERTVSNGDEIVIITKPIALKNLKNVLEANNFKSDIIIRVSEY